MIPHVTNEIKAAVRRVVTDGLDVVIVEIGGTVGDIEILPFLEAIRQFKHDLGRDHTLFVHLTLVPWIAGGAPELKTKPTQHSVKELRALGIQPDILMCRSERPSCPRGRQGKDRAVLRRRCRGRVYYGSRRLESVYEVPLVFADQKVDEIVTGAAEASKRLPRNLSLARLGDLLHGMKNPSGEVRIGLVGKYVEYEDSYKSLKEALLHGGCL